MTDEHVFISGVSEPARRRVLEIMALKDHGSRIVIPIEPHRDPFGDIPVIDDAELPYHDFGPGKYRDTKRYAWTSPEKKKAQRLARKITRRHRK